MARLFDGRFFSHLFKLQVVNPNRPYPVFTTDPTPSEYSNISHNHELGYVGIRIQNPDPQKSSLDRNISSRQISITDSKSLRNPAEIVGRGSY